MMRRAISRSLGRVARPDRRVVTAFSRRVRRARAARDRQLLREQPELDATDLRMMRRALRLAAGAATRGEVPIAAVVWRERDGAIEILAEAANDREASGDPTGHAEIVALRRAGERLGSWRLTGCSMAVTLEPCPMCAGALVNARLDRCVFGASDPKAGACGTLYRIAEDPRLNHRVTVVGGVLAEESVALLRRFFR
ncbi:MAG: nucleoside deaminase, partial [Phycisphaerales bacterium]